MASRANIDLKYTLIKTYVVGAAANAGRVAKLGAVDTEATNAGANEMGIGVFLEDAAPGARVQVAMLAGSSQIKVKVGTGGVTRNAFINCVANGVANVGTLGGGTVLKNVIGLALQSGVAGDDVAMLPCPNAAVSA
ncbi:MAG: hypothetical protein WKG00_03250 [Polyangiaceae bacterium]